VELARDYSERHNRYKRKLLHLRVRQQLEFSGTMKYQDTQMKRSRFSETQIVSVPKEADARMQAK
jgi:hypothetical protein